MPVLERDGRRVMFAHIPKTAGSSIYHAFVEAGWMVRNFGARHYPPSRTLPVLRDRMGIDPVPRRGPDFFWPHPLQHAPHLVWRFWGPFDESFAIVRHPIDRLVSALRYHYDLPDHRPESFEDFVSHRLGWAMERRINVLRVMDGHLIPQVRFLARDTHVLRFEEDWKSALADRYGVDAGALPHANRSQPREVRLSTQQRDWAHRVYAADFDRLGYAPRTEGGDEA